MREINYSTIELSMVAEDVGLLAKRAFAGLVEKPQGQAAAFIALVDELWKAMDGGGIGARPRTRYASTATI